MSNFFSTFTWSPETIDFQLFDLWMNGSAIENAVRVVSETKILSGSLENIGETLREVGDV